jgi:L-fucose isomerase-like protein
MFKGVLDRLGKKYSRLLGRPDDPASLEKALRFCRAASAMKQMRRSRLGLVGYSAMSIYTGTFDHVLLRALLGPEVVHLDSYSIIRTAQAMSAGQISAQEQGLREISPVAADVEKSDLETAASVLLALRKYCLDLDLDGINVKCQCEFSKEFGAVACVPVSALAGPDLVSSCEGDMLCTVSMLLLNKLARQPVSYGDCINHDGSVLTLSACGFMPFSFADREQRLIRKFMPHPGFRGIQNSFVARPGEMTLIRLIEDVGSYHILAVTGQALKESQLRQGIMPSVDVLVHGSMDALIEQYNGQHFAFVYGDWLQDILEYGRLAGIPVVRIQAEKAT